MTKILMKDADFKYVMAIQVIASLTTVLVNQVKNVISTKENRKKYVEEVLKLSEEHITKMLEKSQSIETKKLYSKSELEPDVLNILSDISCTENNAIIYEFFEALRVPVYEQLKAFELRQEKLKDGTIKPSKKSGSFFNILNKRKEKGEKNGEKNPSHTEK